VNLSARKLDSPTVVEAVREALSQAGIEGRNLWLELPEASLLRDADPGRTALSGLAELGISLHIGDFGIGYTSLRTLPRLPLDGVKVDRSLVARLGRGDDSAQTLHAMAALAHTLGLELSAEGVETPDQLERLRAFGFTHAQGYLFAPPLRSSDVDRFLTDPSTALSTPQAPPTDDADVIPIDDRRRRGRRPPG
jgi:EAL domain-containing protein (putative c-di-GMP-specific phosphodiesterase class I)